MACTGFSPGCRDSNLNMTMAGCNITYRIPLTWTWLVRHMPDIGFSLLWPRSSNLEKEIKKHLNLQKEMLLPNHVGLGFNIDTGNGWQSFCCGSHARCRCVWISSRES